MGFVMAMRLGRRRARCGVRVRVLGVIVRLFMGNRFTRCRSSCWVRVFALVMAVPGFAVRVAMAMAIACGLGHGRAQDQERGQRTDDDDGHDQQHMLAGQAALKLR